MPIAPPQGEYIDLSRGPGLRVWVRQAEPTTPQSVLQFHHVCCDGLAVDRVVDDLLLAYHLYAAGCDPASVFKPLEPQRLRATGTLARGASAPVSATCGSGPAAGPAC